MTSLVSDPQPATFHSMTTTLPDELISKILGHSSITDGDLVSAAMACTHFADMALEELWGQRQEFFTPLLRTLPGCSWGMPHENSYCESNTYGSRCECSFNPVNFLPVFFHFALFTIALLSRRDTSYTMKQTRGERIGSSNMQVT